MSYRCKVTILAKMHYFIEKMQKKSPAPLPSAAGSFAPDPHQPQR